MLHWVLTLSLLGNYWHTLCYRTSLFHRAACLFREHLVYSGNCEEQQLLINNRYRHMLLNQIELFVTVAENRNLAKTARRIHVSPSSVSQRLKSLETEMGAKLYQKSKEGIKLTDAGRVLLETANEILSRIETLKKNINSGSCAKAESLVVGGTSNPSARYLPSAIAEFQKTHPHVRITFLTLEKANVERMMREFDIDVAIVQSPSKYSDLHLEYFAVDHLVFFAHPAHPLAKKKKLSLPDLSETPLIVREGRGTTEKLLRQLKSRGMKVNVVLRCLSPDAIKSAVRQQTGIGILFCELIIDDIKRKDLKVLHVDGMPKLAGHSYIVFSNKRSLSPAAEEFVGLLRSRRHAVHNIHLVFNARSN
jgi:DNA-binding transcriptional LysR family regulator